MYYVKAIGGGNNIKQENMPMTQEQITANLQTISTNTKTVNMNAEENRAPIAPDLDTNSSIYANTSVSQDSRYYYNQLGENSKIIYDAIVNNIDKLKNGNERINIDADLSALWNNGNGEEELNDVYGDAVNAVNLDKSELFYIDFSKMSLNVFKTSSFFSTKFEFYIDVDKSRYSNYYADGFENSTQVAIAISQVESVKKQVGEACKGNDYAKIKTVHDWLIEYMEYNGDSSHKASIYGAFLERKGVCESYARSLKYILDDLGIENILATGTATNSSGNTEDKMWNYIKLEGNWYAVDATWDDPVILGGGTISNELKHRYFLKGSKEFFKNHTERMTISESNKIFALPKLSSNNY